MDFAYTFDDVLLLPAFSEVLPSVINIESYFTTDIRLNVPVVSAAMDTVTKSEMAIAMALSGGIGCIHKNMSIKQQVEQVRLVKRHQSWIVHDPVTISPEDLVTKALSLMRNNNYSGIPVVERGSERLVGILTNRDVRFAKDLNQPVSALMTRDDLITVKQGVSHEEALKILHKYRIEKLLVVDEAFRCVGLITVKDIRKLKAYPNACKDHKGRLYVAAAVGVNKQEFERTQKLVEAEVDAIIVDTAHGHSVSVIEFLRNIRKNYPDLQIVAGNIVTAKAAEALIEAGTNAVKVGIGPGAICTTRIIAGVGVPQLSAILNVSKVCKKHGVKVIADGGIKYSGDIAKAIAAGADTVMAGSLLAGTTESPGNVVIYKGKSYKSYRGMGSVGAMEGGSAERYKQSHIKQRDKLVPEGVEGLVPFRGSVNSVIYQLAGGLRSAMGYTGNKNIDAMQRNCKFIRVTSAALREGHVHDILVTHQAPNYNALDSEE
jgi:IMP dehydrogenase